jgi:hypothetical protein
MREVNCPEAFGGCLNTAQELLTDAPSIVERTPNGLHGYWRGICGSVRGPGIRYTVSTYQRLMTMNVLVKDGEALPHSMSDRRRARETSE